jgi:phage-related protein
MGDSLAVLREFPQRVREEIGYAIFLAQTGDKHPNVKPLKGFGGGVLEAVSDHMGNTYRAVYTVRLAGKVYVLHAFQKKSKKGVSTPKMEIDSIRRRLKGAVELHSAKEA